MSSILLTYLLTYLFPPPSLLLPWSTRTVGASHESPPVVSVHGHHHCFLNGSTALHQNVVDLTYILTYLLTYLFPPPPLLLPWSTKTVGASQESPPVVSVHGHHHCFLNGSTAPHQNVVKLTYLLTYLLYQLHHQSQISQRARRLPPRPACGASWPVARGPL